MELDRNPDGSGLVTLLSYDRDDALGFLRPIQVEETCQWRAYDRGVLSGARLIFRKAEDKMSEELSRRYRRSSSRRAAFTLGFSEACRHVRQAINVALFRCRDWVNINARRLRSHQLGAFDHSPDCLDQGIPYIPLPPSDQEMDSDGLEVGNG